MTSTQNKPHRGLATALCTLPLLLAASAAVGQDSAQVRLAYATQTTHAFGIGADAFIETLGELTDGRYTVAEFPAGALGGERENVEQLQAGALDVSITTTGVLANFIPEFGIIDLPFLFEDYDHAHAVLDGEIGDELRAKLESIGVVGLCWGESGFRQVYTDDRPVRTPADLGGIKIRTMEVPEHILAFESLGATPTAIAFPEVFTALQQGTADAAEGPAQSMLSGRFYEVQKYLSFTNHLYAASLVLVSADFFNGLTDEDKEAFRQAADASCAAQRDFVSSGEADATAELQGLGVTVTPASEIDRAAFVEALEPAYEEYAKEFGEEAIERIRTYGE